MKIKRFWLKLSSISLFLLLMPLKAGAVCPVCTVAVGAGVGLSRWLGIDDTISGVWIGGLLVSSIIMTEFWLDKKKIFFNGRRIALIILYYGLTVLPVYFFTDIIGSKQNQLWGIDKLLLGLTLGSLAFIGAAQLHFWLKQNNKDKVYFPFQKVVIPVSGLGVLSLIFWGIT